MATNPPRKCFPRFSLSRFRDKAYDYLMLAADLGGGNIVTAEDRPESLEQLAETVGQLAQALAASERRRATLSQRVRWGPPFR